MSNTTNPLIGATQRETIENAAEALSAAVVLLADKHSDLCRLLTPVLDVLEREDVAGDADAIDGAAEAFSAAIVLMADRHSDLCRLLMPVLQAVEHASLNDISGIPTHDEVAELANAGMGTVRVGGPTPEWASGLGVPPNLPGSADPIAEYNRCAAQVRAENAI